MPRVSTPALAAGVLVVALLLRLAVLPIADGRVPAGDPLNYWIIAENIVAGRGMVIDDPHLIANLRALYPPLYPLILSLVGFVVPLGAPTFLGVNFAVDAATAVAIVWLGRACGVRRAALFAAALYLLWPTNVLLSPLAQKEGLVCLLAVLLACFIVKREAIGTGVCWGLIALANPGLAFLPLVFAIALRRDPRLVINAGLAAAAVMLPWWIRNFLVFGQFLPLTTSTGLALWIGAHPDGGTTWIQPGAHLLRGSELDVAAASLREAWGWIIADPTAYLARCIGKVPSAFFGDFSAIARLNNMRPRIDFPILPLIVLNLVVPLLLFSSALAALLKQPTSIPARLLIACFVHILLFQIWFEFSERHRLYANPFLMLLVAGGASALLRISDSRQIERHPFVSKGAVGNDAGNN